MGPPAGSRPKEKERERTNNYWHLSGSLCSWRLWGFQPGSRPKDKGKEREESQKSEMRGGIE